MHMSTNPNLHFGSLNDKNGYTLLGLMDFSSSSEENLREMDTEPWQTEPSLI
jgi:hypothetical protein